MPADQFKIIGIVGHVVVLKGVVAGMGEGDSIVVVRGVYILYSTVIRVVEVNSSFPITSCPGHGEA